MKKKLWVPRISNSTVLYFIPLIVAGGRLVTRVVFNLWDMLEGGGRHLVGYS